MRIPDNEKPDALLRMSKKLVFILSLILLASMLFVLPASAAQVSTPQQDLSPYHYEQMVRDTLTALATAYEQKDLRAFMNLVSPDFAGDDFLLYRAVRRDFRFFDNIDLRLDVDGFAIDRKGRAQVTVKYNRSVIANKDSRSYKDSGLTQMTYQSDAGQIKLYDMKFPLIFGLSEGLQVASGVVRTTETSNVLVVDRRGNVNVVPFREALEAANNNSVVRGITSLRADATGMDNWSFADNRKSRSMTLQGDFAIESFLMFKAGTKWLKLPASTDFASLTQVPNPATTTYNTTTITPGSPVIGDVYALQLASGKFAVIEIRDYQASAVGGSWTAVVRYQYQPSGSRNF